MREMSHYRGLLKRAWLFERSIGPPWVCAQCQRRWQSGETSPFAISTGDEAQQDTSYDECNYTSAALCLDTLCQTWIFVDVDGDVEFLPSSAESMASEFESFRALDLEIGGG
jgi:hypothetical protein